MSMRKLSGWKRGSTMPAHTRAMLGPTRSFTDVHHVFKAKAAASSGDHKIPNEPPCFNQGELGSCVLNMVVGAIAVLLAVEGLPFTMLSRLFLYWLCNLYQGTPGEDDGTYVHVAVERVGKIGVPAETMWPYDDGPNALVDTHGKPVNPSPECFPAASDNKATAWLQIADSPDDAQLDEMESAVRANHPVGFGSDVDASIQRYQKGDVLTAPNRNALIGGHSMLVTGVIFVNGRRLWWVRNSWDVDYGDDGHLLADDDFMRQAEDRFVLTRMDPLLFG